MSGPSIEVVYLLWWSQWAVPEVLYPHRWPSKEHILGTVHCLLTNDTSSMAMRPSKPERTASNISWWEVKGQKGRVGQESYLLIYLFMAFWKLPWYFVWPQGDRNYPKSQTTQFNPCTSLTFFSYKTWSINICDIAWILKCCLMISGSLELFHTWKSVIWCGTGQCASCQMLPWAPLRVHRTFS